MFASFVCTEPRLYPWPHLVLLAKPGWLLDIQYASTSRCVAAGSGQTLALRAIPARTSIPESDNLHMA